MSTEPLDDSRRYHADQERATLVNIAAYLQKSTVLVAGDDFASLTNSMSIGSKEYALFYSIFSFS